MQLLLEGNAGGQGGVGGQGGLGGLGGLGGMPGQNPNVIRVTPEEKEAIDRVKTL